MDTTHRPIYHFITPKNWMNDPNGPLQYKGVYHLFYQVNPREPVFNNRMMWGHATSRDLVHWKHRPHALKPNTPSDRRGCWSGSSFIDEGVPTLVYAGFMPNPDIDAGQTICVATSRQENLLTWKKHPQNPGVIRPVEYFQNYADGRGIYMDAPYVWRQGKTYYMIAGIASPGKPGELPLFKSRDLIHWTYMHPLMDWDGGRPGRMWAICPKFLKMGRKWVLFVSPIWMIRSVYYVGTYKNHKFVPEYQGELDLGGSFYAADAFKDERGRHILFGWLKETCSQKMSIDAGWCGAMSLPRVMTLGENNRLCFEPEPALEKLRCDGRHFKDILLRPGKSGYLPEIKGKSLEIEAEIDLKDANQVGFKLRRSANGSEETIFVYDRRRALLISDCRQSSKRRAAHRRQYVSREYGPNSNVYKVPFKLTRKETLKLRLFLDYSIVEAFVNGRTCVSSRIYPSQKNSLGIDLFAKGGSATVKSLNIWTMKSI